MLNIILLLITSAPHIFASENVKTLRLCENTVARALINPRGTVIDFPATPEKVVLGTKGSFGTEYIRNDLAISPATSTSRSNLFVYLHGRRFSLDLSTSSEGATLYFIKDCQEQKVTEKRNGR